LAFQCVCALGFIEEGILHGHALQGEFRVINLLGESTVAVNQCERTNALLLGGSVVVGPKARRQMDHACAVVGSHEIARYYPKGIALFRLRIGQELLVAQSAEAFTRNIAQSHPRQRFTARLG